MNVIMGHLCILARYIYIYFNPYLHYLKLVKQQKENHLSWFSHAPGSVEISGICSLESLQSLWSSFYLYCKGKLKGKNIFLNRSEPYYIHDIDHSQHGDVGTNGSRGSARGMAKTPDRMTIGHSHGARICMGVYQVGTSTGKLEYERGLSDHSNTHCLQYKNGKRTLIDIIDNKYCL